MADVFLSYRNTPTRRAYIERLRLCLDSFELSVWWDYGLEAGVAYEEQIIGELRSAAIICPIWCEKSILSDWVIREARFGLDQGKLLPARIQQVAPPAEFEPIQCQDLVDWAGSPESYLITAFAGSISKRLRRNLSPISDKLRALRNLPELPPLSSEPQTVAAGQVAQLQIERTAQMSAGGSAFHIFWNKERLGQIRMGNSSAFDLAPGRGNLQIGMRHVIKRSLHVTAPISLSLKLGEVTRVKIKVGANLWGFPPLQFLVDDDAEPQTRGWVENL
jgi:hypothetical protein